MDNSRTPEPLPAVKKSKRRFLRRSLWGALAFVLIISIPCSWVVVTVLRTKKRSWAEAKRQREAVLAIHKMGWEECYDFQVGGWVAMHPPDTRPLAIAWVQNSVGVDVFSDVISVDIGQASPFEETDVDLSCLEDLPQLQSLELSQPRYTDAALVHLRSQTHLKVLVLDGRRVTDAGLENVKGLTELEQLLLFGTEVTDEGVRKLQEALPKCSISRIK